MARSDLDPGLEAYRDHQIAMGHGPYMDPPVPYRELPPRIYVEVEEPVPFEHFQCRRNDWCSLDDDHDSPCCE